MANTALATTIEADDDFTPGELAFMNSRGQNSDLLLQENNLPTAPDIPGVPEAPAPASPAVPPGPAAAPADQLPAVESPPLAPTDEADDDEVEEPQIDPKTKQPAKPRLVNYGKYKKAKDQVSVFQAQLAEREAALREREVTQASLEERLNLINEALAQPEPQPQEDALPERPDPEQDIFGYAKWLEQVIAHQDRRFSALEQEHTATAQQRQSEAVQQETVNRYRAEAQSFARTQPAFGQAYNWLQNIRTIELSLTQLGKNPTVAGQQLTPQEAQWVASQIAQEELGLVQTSHARGTNPAEVLYNFAVARGFKPEAQPNGGAPPVAPSAAAPGATPASPPPQGTSAPGAAATPSVADEIDRIIKGREATTSLSQGGGSPPDNWNAQTLGNLSDEEFFAFLDQLDRNPAAKKRFQEAMGK